MSYRIRVFTILTILCFALTAQAARKRQKLPYETPDEPPVPLGYTHILPSALVIPGGTVVLGTTVGIGFFDVFDVTTNLYLDFAQVFNVGGKVSVWKDESFAVALFGNYFSESVQTFDVNNNPQTNTMTAVAPGAIVSYYLVPQITGHTGVTYFIRNPNITKSMLVSRNGFIQGTVVNQEATFGLTRTLALSSGVSYDLVFDVWGAGASLHVGGFQIGGHYYFNVATNQFLPILGGAFTANY